MSSNVAATLIEGEGKGRPQAAGGQDSASSFYLPELDILRFFAFLSVFAFHACLLLPRAGPPARSDLVLLSYAGSFGVDLFFALSAYLITQLLLKEQQTNGTVDVKSFYVRRLLRIWPLYFFFLAAMFVLSKVLYRSNYYQIFAVPPIYFLAYTCFVGNFAVTYLGDPALVIGPLWSVSIEEQFYLMWPWAVRRASRRSVARVGIAMLVVASFARLALSWHGSFQEIWYNTFARLDPIAVGILLAVVPTGRMPDLRLPARLVLALAGAASWLLLAYYCSVVWSDRSAPLTTMVAYPIAALGCGALLVAVLGIGVAGLPAPLSRSLIYLGKISYGLYVYHGLAIELARLVCFLVGRDAAWKLGNLQFLYLVISFTLTLILAATSYRWLEAPFLRLKRRFTVVASRPV